MKLLRTTWLAFAYYLSWLFFGLGACALYFVFTPLLLVGNREWLSPLARRCSALLIKLWLFWFQISGVMRVTWRGFDVELKPGTVFVANHPSLVDAPLLLSKLPGTFCIFKSALLRNFFVGPMAVLSGYLPGDSSVDTIRKAARKVAQGQSLLIFPEGTRTSSSGQLNPLKPGFALIAQVANAPVQIIRVRCSLNVASKNQDWWRLPPLPAWYEFSMDERLVVDPTSSPSSLVERLDLHLRGQMASPLHPATR